MIKKLLPLLLIGSLSATVDLPPLKELTVQQLLTALTYIKEENKELSEILPELHQEALDALDESYPFKAIDILIRALQYALERICSFNDNFDVHLYTAHLNLPETILTPIDMDLVRTPLTPANDEHFSFIDYGQSL